MTIIFDMDDTLYDRGMPFVAAVREFFSEPIKNPREAYRTCTARGNEVFLPSQRGEISMDEMYIYRWGKGFADVGVRISAEEALGFQAVYRRKQHDIEMSPVIEKMLEICKKNAEAVGMITNGPSDKQWGKINSLGLEKYLDREITVISGDVKLDKPDPAIFRLAEARSGKQPEELIYVGDSLYNDIYPAAACGWRTIWFNRDGSPVPADVHIDIIVETEEQLLDEISKLF